MNSVWIFIVTVLVTTVVIDLVYSQNPTQNGNPGTANNSTSMSDTTNNVNAVNKPLATGNGNRQRSGNGSMRPAGRPKRRRGRRRRVRKGRRNRKNRGKARTVPKTAPPQSATESPMVNLEPNISGKETNQVLIKGAAAMTGGPYLVKDSSAPRKEPKKNPVDNTFDQSDSFFDFFNEMTTTVEPDYNAPPPSFDPKKKPRKKVMPIVDASKAKAHDGTPCNETYQPHNTTKTMYKMKNPEGEWKTLKCPPNLGSGLVWRQDLCACGEQLMPRDPLDWCANMGYDPNKENRHKYFRRHHGTYAVMECAANLVWSQEKCQCAFDPSVIARPIEEKVTFVCKTILHLDFERNLTNTADGYFVKRVNLRRRGKLPRIRFMPNEGAKGKAALIVSQPLEFQAFRGNDFQTQVTYSINFKISPRHRSRKNFMTLLTDECLGAFVDRNKERKPTFSLTFQPRSQSFRLQFRTDLAEVDEIVKGAKPDKNGWYRTVVYFEDATVNLESNGKKLFKMPDIFGKIPQNKCPLYIAGRGIGYDRSQDFYGYIDDVFLVKDCRFQEMNIKLL